MPDIYVFRFTGSAPNPPLDDPNYEKVKREWESLSAFIAEWFRAPEGHSRPISTAYARRTISRRSSKRCCANGSRRRSRAARAARWPIEINGSPFRGLDAFGAMHAPVFFGRSREVARAVDLWRKAAARLAPFLLLLGPSGAGKSSLARAGVLIAADDAGRDRGGRCLANRGHAARR